VAGAAADLGAISKRLESAYPVNKGHHAFVTSLSDALRGELRPAMLLLFVTVALVLLIACSNVANLLLARSVARSREIALRLSLGGSRLRLVRQLLTESLVLSSTGAAMGIAAAFGGVLYLRSILPASSNIGPEDLRVDLTVLGYTTAIALLCALLFGLAPALTATRGSLSHSIRFAGRNQTESPWHRRQRSGLLTMQIAIAVLLLIGGGLLMRSFQTMQAVHPGFVPDSLLTIYVQLPAAYREEPRKVAFQHELLDRVRALHGVAAAGTTSFLPFSDQNSRMGFVIENIAPDPNEPRRANWRLVSPGYMETMKIPLLRGRFLQESDRQGTPLVMLVNETTVKRYWGGRDPIGWHARLATMNSWATVVGVVGDVKHWGLEENARPEAYLSSYQAPFPTLNLVARTNGAPQSLAGAIRAELRALDASIPVRPARTMDDLITASSASRRFLTELVEGFALIALLLAAGGAFAQVAYSVSQRTQEIGIRMALGAGRPSVVALMLRQVLALVAVGGVLGVAAMWWVGPLIRKMLFVIEPQDTVTLVGAPVLMLAIAAIACSVPSGKAARTDPAEALRAE
jgi:putative ABC transport system permease protein